MTQSPIPKEALRVMLVDDFPSMRKIISDQLVALGISGKNIIQMKNGDEALAALRGGSDDAVDLIVSDWVMPKMSGIEFLRTVKADSELQAIPFVMLTSEGSKEQVVEAIKEGVNGYIVKPASIGTMTAKLHSLFPHAGFQAAANKS